MRRKLTLAALLTAVLLLCACAEKTEGYQVYFTVSSDSSYGSALATQRWTGGRGEPTAEQLMEALLSGPNQEGLTSPFPRGVSVQTMELDESAKKLRLTLSEQYGGLTDIDQTLADACIVMTLCQLPGVEAVEISTVGSLGGRPASRTLSPSELQMDSLLP